MRKPMTDREFYKAMDRRQTRVFDVVKELHIAGFSTIYVQSQAIGRDDYFTRVFINDATVDSDRFESLTSLVSELEGVTLALAEDRALGTRLALWVHDGN